MLQDMLDIRNKEYLFGFLKFIKIEKKQGKLANGSILFMKAHHKLVKSQISKANGSISGHKMIKNILEDGEFISKSIFDVN